MDKIIPPVCLAPIMNNDVESMITYVFLKVKVVNIMDQTTIQ